MTDEATAGVIARALGEELRRAREARGWSRAQFVKGLPSQIGDRTLLAYEHGLRQITMLRLLELAEGLGVPASVLVAQAMQRARLYLQNLVLRVDLRQLLQDNNMNYRPLSSWARNRLNRAPGGVIEVTPSGVWELAAVLGRTPQELSAYFAKFTPDDATEGEVEAVPA
ncbi:helix-turn-helix domain-containing protein [Actinophytocola sp. NPDC049390]|uniref:helix-turn-helix domain-containing protein n=1 Tax=Actinophytocola sp. NPDC049390 TaxID=3363894 RepID=UPI0037ABDBDB